MVFADFYAWKSVNFFQRAHFAVFEILRQKYVFIEFGLTNFVVVVGLLFFSFEILYLWVIIWKQWNLFFFSTSNICGYFDQISFILLKNVNFTYVFKFVEKLWPMHTTIVILSRVLSDFIHLNFFIFIIAKTVLLYAILLKNWLIEVDGSFV